VQVLAICQARMELRHPSHRRIQTILEVVGAGHGRLAEVDVSLPHSAVEDVRCSREAGRERCGGPVVDVLGRSDLLHDTLSHHHNLTCELERLLLIVGSREGWSRPAPDGGRQANAVEKKREARETSGSSPAETGNHLWPLGPSAPSNLSRLSRFPPASPFVGLWGLPSLPTRRASWPSQPYEQVRPVGLTAFPGGPVRFPDSTAPAARSNADSTNGPAHRQGDKIPGDGAFAQVNRPVEPV